MKTKILFFGALADGFGRERVVELPAEGATVGALRELAASNEHEAAALRAAGVKAAVGQRLAGDEARVRPGDEIALFSPVSGG